MNALHIRYLLQVVFIGLNNNRIDTCMDPRAAIFCEGSHLQEIFLCFPPLLRPLNPTDIECAAICKRPSSEQFSAAIYAALSVDGILLNGADSDVARPSRPWC
jgi:hypothetical protein